MNRRLFCRFEDRLNYASLAETVRRMRMCESFGLSYFRSGLFQSLCHLLCLGCLYPETAAAFIGRNQQECEEVLTAHADRMCRITEYIQTLGLWGLVHIQFGELYIKPVYEDDELHPDYYSILKRYALIEQIVGWMGGTNPKFNPEFRLAEKQFWQILKDMLDSGDSAGQLLPGVFRAELRRAVLGGQNPGLPEDFMLYQVYFVESHNSVTVDHRQPVTVDVSQFIRFKPEDGFSGLYKGGRVLPELGEREIRPVFPGDLVKLIRRFPCVEVRVTGQLTKQLRAWCLFRVNDRRERTGKGACSEVDNIKTTEGLAGSDQG